MSLIQQITTLNRKDVSKKHNPAEFYNIAEVQSTDPLKPQQLVLFININENLESQSELDKIGNAMVLDDSQILKMNDDSFIWTKQEKDPTSPGEISEPLLMEGSQIIVDGDCLYFLKAEEDPSEKYLVYENPETNLDCEQSKGKIQNFCTIKNGKKMYHCSFCTKEFSSRSSFSIHLANHQGTKFQCKYCQKYLKTEENLKTHELRHSEKPTTCKICGKTYNNWRLLNLHVKVHNRQKRLYSCDVCHSSFPIVDQLRVHKKTHNQKPFFCQSCNKYYTTLENLHLHIKYYHTLKT